MKRISSNSLQSIVNKGKKASSSRQLHLSCSVSAKHVDQIQDPQSSSHSSHSKSRARDDSVVDYSDIVNGDEQQRQIALNRLRNQPTYLARYRSLDPIKSSRADRSPSQIDVASNSNLNFIPYSNNNKSNSKPISNLKSTCNSTLTQSTCTTHPLSTSSYSIPSTSSNSTQPLSIRSSSSSSHSSNTNTPPTEKDKDSSSWAFGGGASSRGGPVTAHDFFEQQQASSSSSSGTGRDPQNGVIGSAGKGAVVGYGKRKKQALPEHKFLGRNSFDENLSAKDLELARNYKHEYAPTTRSARPLPQHTYFTSPSSSFNASSQVAPGTAKPIGRPGSGSAGGARRKKTALISPGQGSQYVAMSRDLYKAFRSARTTWHAAEEALLYTPNLSGSTSSLSPSSDRSQTLSQREAFERELEKSYHLDSKRGFSASGTSIVRGRRGYLRDTVFSGDQLDLTRSENAQPSILACHGSGTYASLVASGSIDFQDALRCLRHRGLIASHYVSNHPILFPKGCVPPDSIYESWAFTNAGNGKGADLVDAMMDSGGVPITNSTTDREVARNETRLQEDQIVTGKDEGVNEGLSNVRKGWKRSQMSGFMVRAGKLNDVLQEVTRISKEIHSGEIPGVASDEVVEIANINSQLQVVLSGTRVGVSLACDRLRNLGLGARAVNLPVSGPYHTSLMKEAGESLYPMVELVPLSTPNPNLSLVSSVNGKILKTANDVRQDLFGALYKPVRWLDSIDTMVNNGVERFICLGPGRACAHLLSKELALRDKLSGNSFGNGENKREFEVWSVATVEDVEQLGGVLSKISEEEGATRNQEQISDQIMAL